MTENNIKGKVITLSKRTKEDVGKSDGWEFREEELRDTATVANYWNNTFKEVPVENYFNLTQTLTSVFDTF